MRKISILAVACFFTAFGCKDKSKAFDKFNPNAPVTVDVAIAANQKVEKMVEVNGAVASTDYVELRPETNGRVVFLQIPEGKTVQAGTILA